MCIGFKQNDTEKSKKYINKQIINIHKLNKCVGAFFVNRNLLFDIFSPTR